MLIVTPWSLGWLALACAAISFTLTKTPVFDWWRQYLLKKVRGKLTSLHYELWGCPYCMGHWVAAVLVLFSPMVIITTSGWLDYFVSVFIVTIWSMFYVQVLILAKDVMDFLRAATVRQQAEARAALAEIGRH